MMVKNNKSNDKKKKTKILQAKKRETQGEREEEEEKKKVKNKTKQNMKIIIYECHYNAKCKAIEHVTEDDAGAHSRQITTTTKPNRQPYNIVNISFFYST
jgi:hypothetical protein